VNACKKTVGKPVLRVPFSYAADQVCCVQLPCVRMLLISFILMESNFKSLFGGIHREACQLYAR